MPNRDSKQVIVIRRDLKMRRGKEISQGAHAAMAWMAPMVLYGVVKTSEAEEHWLREGFRKITCQVQSAEELLELYDRAKAAGITVYSIIDSGCTEFHGEPTLTCIAIGPDWEEKIDAITGDLALY